MNDYQDDTFLARWLSGNLSEEELKRFEASEDFAELQRILGGVELLASHPFASGELKERINMAIQAGQATQAPTVRSFPRWIWAVAATLLLLLLSYLFWPFGNQEVEMLTSVGEKLIEQELPDGSTFSLNVDSKIQFNNNWNSTRQVALEGEAFFEVKKGGDFVVNSPQGKVKVLGTSFNVISRQNLFEVACFSGRVQVEPQTGPSKELTPGMAYRLNPQDQLSTMRTISEEQKEQSWKADVTWLIDRSFQEIIDEFLHHYELEIILEQGLEKKEGFFTTPIPHNNLRLAIEATFDALEVRIDTSELGKGKLKLYQIK